MRDYSGLMSIILAVLLAFIPLASIAEPGNLKSSKSNFTYELIKKSPSSFEIENATPLYTGAINTFSPQGHDFANKQLFLAREIVDDIDSLSTKMSITKTLNKKFMDSLTRQLAFWKDASTRYPELKPVYLKEMQTFNYAFEQQMTENIKWAIIDSTLKEIENLNLEDNTPVNESVTKSYLYSRLLLNYSDLIDFYEKKYQDVILITILNHSVQENPNLQIKIPSDILDTIKPIHKNELEASKSLIYDLGENLEKISQLDLKAKELRDLYHDIDKYSLEKVKQIITELSITVEKTEKEPSNSVAKKLLPALNSYIDFYKALEKQLEEKILAYEISEAIYVAQLEDKGIKLAYTGPLNNELYYSGLGDWISSAVSGTVKVITRTAKTAATTVTAGVNYTTGKASELLFEGVDKAQAAYDKGLFSDEYKEWAKNYDKASQGGVSIKKTFVDAVVKTATTGETDESLTKVQAGIGTAYATADVATGKMADTIYGTDTTDAQKTLYDPLSKFTSGQDYSIGQSSIQKAGSSFQSVDNAAKSLTFGYDLPAQVALNLVTFGGYGLAKDSTTVVDNSKSEAERNAAALGVILSLAPALSASNKGAREATKTGLKSTKDNLVKNVVNASDEISSTIAKKSAADASVKSAYQKFGDALQNIKKFFGKADPLDSSYSAAGKQLDNAVLNVSKAKATQNAVKQELKDAIVNNASKVGGEMLDNVITTGGKAIKEIIKDNLPANVIDRIKGAWTKSISQQVTDSGGLMGFILDNIANNAMNSTITDQAKTALEKNNISPDNTTQISQSNNNTPDNTTPSNPDQSSNNVVPIAPVIKVPLALINPTPPNNVGLPPGYTPPYLLPQGPQVPNQTDPDLLNQYLSSNNQSQNDQSNVINQIDQTIGLVQQQNQDYNQGRQTVNTNPQNPNTAQTFNTDLTGTQPGGDMMSHITTLSQQTAGMNNNKQNNNNSGGNSTSTQNIPGYDGNTEPRYDGKDDDNDGMIDEGFNNGNCQIIIHDTGGDKDDQWSLKVDGQGMGTNTAGKTRNWDLNLSKGQHQVSFTGVNIPDNVGTYTVVFQKAQLVGGPSLTGRNLNQGTTFTWTINVR